MSTSSPAVNAWSRVSTARLGSTVAVTRTASRSEPSAAVHLCQLLIVGRGRTLGRHYHAACGRGAMSPPISNRTVTGAILKEASPVILAEMSFPFEVQESLWQGLDFSVRRKWSASRSNVPLFRHLGYGDMFAAGHRLLLFMSINLSMETMIDVVTARPKYRCPGLVDNRHRPAADSGRGFCDFPRNPSVRAADALMATQKCQQPGKHRASKTRFRLSVSTLSGFTMTGSKCGRRLAASLSISSVHFFVVTGRLKPA